MRALLLFLLLLSAAAFLPCPPILLDFAQDDRTPVEVLFIGNSFTYGYDMPEIIRSLSADAPHPIVVDYAVVGGYTMAAHMERAETLTKLREHHWDYVVLQDCSDCSFYRTADFLNGMRNMTALVRGQGATPLYYLTWSDKGKPEVQRQITAAYTKLGSEQRVQVVPVGEVWAELQQSHREINLHDPDNHHASRSGALLTALTFIRVLEPNYQVPEDNSVKLKPTFLYQLFIPVRATLGDAAVYAAFKDAVSRVVH